jgi:hypothetical protein
MPVDTRLTYEDFCLLPNDGKRYEIIAPFDSLLAAPVTRLLSTVYLDLTLLERLC